jgi:hypothetical protein
LVERRLFTRRRELGERDGEGDGVYVEPGHAVGRLSRVGVGEHPVLRRVDVVSPRAERLPIQRVQAYEGAEIEHLCQVDVEGVVARPGEKFVPAAPAHDKRVGVVFVARILVDERRRALADVGRRDLRSLEDRFTVVAA